MTPAFAADEHGELAKELLTFLKAKERMGVAVEQIVAIQVQRDPRLGRFKEEVRNYVAKYLAWDSMESGIVEEYKQYFTEAELREILAFYKSETGRKALTHMERIIRAAGKSRNDLLQQNSGELRAAIEARQRSQGGTKPSTSSGAHSSGHSTGSTTTPPAKPATN